MNGESFNPEPEREPRQLSQREMVDGVLTELTPKLEGVRGPALRDVWRLTRAWLQEEQPDYKQEIYDRLQASLRAAIVRVQHFAMIGEMPPNPDANYEDLLEALMRLAVALDVPLEGVI